jgi:hypothetical protein
MTAERPQDEPKGEKAERSDRKPPVSRSGIGRQKQMNPFSVDLKGALQTPVQVNHSGKLRMVRSQQALLLRLREKALQGDHRSLERLLAYGQRFNNDSKVSGKAFTATEDQAIITGFADIVRLHGPSSGQQPLPGSDAALAALLRTRLGFFIRKAFATISPGDTYLHNGISRRLNIN